MSKRTVFTTITPLPECISRETVIEFLHNHLEMIDLNPLVQERHPIKPPAHASPEEYHCIWYQLTDKVSYLPGGRVTGDVAYTCAFHDLPMGLQTHCYAPLGLDIRDKWSLGGTLPGEPAMPVELGLGVPMTGLYLREDVDMRCNIFVTPFVKKTLKKAHAHLVERLKVKAQIATAAERNMELEHQRREQAMRQQMLFEARNNPLPPLPPSSPPPFDGHQSHHHNQQYSLEANPYHSPLMSQSTGTSTASSASRQNSIRDSTGRVTWQSLNKHHEADYHPTPQRPSTGPGAFPADPSTTSRWSASTAATSLSRPSIAPSDWHSQQHASWADLQRSSVYSGDYAHTEEVPIRYVPPQSPPPPMPSLAEAQSRLAEGKAPVMATPWRPAVAELE